jgi:fatty acid desaturase
MDTSTARPAPPWRLNLVLLTGHLLLHAQQLFLLPLLLPASASWLLALLPGALLTNAYWALLHEAIHGHLHPRRAVNDALGRTAAVFFGAPFRLLRVGHLAHHRFSRTALERSEVYDPGAARRAAAAWRYYPMLFGGLYLAEVLGALLAFLPRPWGERLLKGAPLAAWLAARLAGPAARRELRRDAALTVFVYGTSAWLYGPHWPWLLALVLARAFLISFLDNVYHYATPLDDPGYAHNLRLPRPLAWLLLHFNLHGVHHRQPALPWNALPAAFRALDARYHGGYARAALAQLRGPLASTRLAAGGG